jgi:hypothetical protein
MQRLLATAAAAAVLSLSPVLMPDAAAITPGTAPGIRQGLANTSAIEKVVRVCRHNFWTSRRTCWVDRSRPPTVCHHLRNSSRRDCY